MSIRRAVYLTSAGLLAAGAASVSTVLPAQAQKATRVTIAVTDTSNTFNPYGESNSLMYGVWCHVYGCLVDYDGAKGEYVGLLAERWDIPDPNTWVFHLRRDIRWQNGEPLKASDVIHSYNRILNDPESKQQSNVSMVAKMEAVDDNTVKVTTKSPTASLLSYLVQLIVTNKSIYDKYGAKVADSKHPIGAGEYKLERMVPGQMIALAKNADFPGMKDRKGAPDRIIYQIVREPEARLVGLFNGEYQVVQRLLPDLIPRVKDNPKTKVESARIAEFMFLGMTPKQKPWDNKLVRQAVCYAIDRDSIIKNVLKGEAERLDGVVGPGQYGYDPATKVRYPYDPAKAKALLAEAGFPNGVDVDLYTSTGRYLLDKTITESIVPMLGAVGIRATLHTPEVATYWANIQRGDVPFYYWGRQAVMDPSAALSQFFETGGSPRIGISDTEIDKYLQLERKTFDPQERKRVLNQAFNAILDAAPACLLWRYKHSYGVSKTVDFTPRPDDWITPNDVRLVQ
ncbi:MAG: ABC transporter substrate-binding protein [Pseudolabrys sp.]